jgi:hypothetical protein
LRKAPRLPPPLLRHRAQMKKAALKLLFFIRLESNPLEQCVAHAFYAAIRAFLNRRGGP